MRERHPTVSHLYQARTTRDLNGTSGAIPANTRAPSFRWSKFVTELARLFRCWWTVDRIRVSPLAGQLLRLGPGAVMQVRGLAVQIRSRSVIQEASGARITYCCDSVSGGARLILVVGVTGQVSEFRWIDTTGESVLTADDLEVWG